MKTNYKTIILAIGLFLALFILGSAAPGDLDLNFGNGGKVITFTGFQGISDIVLQPDGKIVAVGNRLGALARYNTDGSLDASFGTGGIVNYDFNYNGSSIALQPDGRIVVAGSFCSQSTCDFAVARYHADGSLDKSFSFDGDGIIIFDMGSYDFANDVVIQTDGRIIVVGSSGTANSRNYAFAVARLDMDGSLDTSFGGDGRVVTSLGNFSDLGARAAALQTDGKILVAGQGGSGGFATADFALVRYNSNGSLDTTFDGDGKVINDVGGGYDGASGVVVQTDGKIVVCGSGYLADTAIVRYNPDGSPDASFDGDGILITNFGFRPSSLGIQSNGKIIVTGDAIGNASIESAVVRYNPNGSLDASFGSGGITTTDFGNEGNFGANAVAIQPDGKIVAAGYYGLDGEFSVFALARYRGDPAASQRTNFDFDGDGRSDLSVFRPSDRVWYLNRSSQGFSSLQFGLSSDQITPADFDGDGKTDIAVFREGFWYWLNSSNGIFNAVQFGLARDVPVPADFTGDGRAELAVFRGGIWFTFDLTNNKFNGVQFGISTDNPVAADYDGDGKADFAVYRDGVWYLLQSNLGFSAVHFGLPTDRLVPADYDGDGKTDFGVFRAGIWYLQQSGQGFTAFQFGLLSDIPAPADYDGDGRTDAAVFRDGNWFLRQSANGFSAQKFGLTSDKPVPTAYLP